MLEGLLEGRRPLLLGAGTNWIYCLVEIGFESCIGLSSRGAYRTVALHYALRKGLLFSVEAFMGIFVLDCYV